jgi:pilus assembly protein CpaD
MPFRCRALLAAAALGAFGLSGCVPLPADYTESEWAKTLRLDPAPAQLLVGFAPGAAAPRPGDLARLRATAASGGFVPSDRLVVAVAGSPALASTRFAVIAAALLPYGIVPSRASDGAAPADAAVIRRERFLVALPPCPNWSKPAAGAGDFTNTVSSNFGCADAVNLGLIVAQPADLAAPRGSAFSDAHPAAHAVDNYRLGKVQLPAAAQIGPIAAPTSQAPAAPAAAAGGEGGAGGGGTGVQP